MRGIRDEDGCACQIDDFQHPVNGVHHDHGSGALAQQQVLRPLKLEGTEHAIGLMNVVHEKGGAVGHHEQVVLQRVHGIQRQSRDFDLVGSDLGSGQILQQQRNALGLVVQRGEPFVGHRSGLRCLHATGRQGSVGQIPGDHGGNENQNGHGHAPGFPARWCPVLLDLLPDSRTNPRPCLTRPRQHGHDAGVHRSLVKELPPAV